MGGAYASGTAFAIGSGGGSFGRWRVWKSIRNFWNRQTLLPTISTPASDNLSKAASDTSEAAEKLSEAVSGYTDGLRCYSNA